MPEKRSIKIVYHSQHLSRTGWRSLNRPNWALLGNWPELSVLMMISAISESPESPEIFGLSPRTKSLLFVANSIFRLKSDHQTTIRVARLETFWWEFAYAKFALLSFTSFGHRVYAINQERQVAHCWTNRCGFSQFIQFDHVITRW